MDQSPTVQALGRAGRRAVFHLLAAAVEGLKAVEAIIEEIGGIADEADENASVARTQKIEVE